MSVPYPPWTKKHDIEVEIQTVGGSVDFIDTTSDYVVSTCETGV